ncbi:MAG: PEGA domain-containing protein [Candidatus Omnitrophica bacterium]|nr:PEGA domain-containing protein [Candidatus Omnitrophota bacterium]
MLFLRKVLFYIFLLLYVVICPLAILYAFGFILTPGQEESVVKTGLIYVSSAPSGAAIYLDAKDTTQKTPATLQQILPGKHTVLLTMKDYKPWVYSADVKANEPTVVDNILLIPYQWPISPLTDDAFSDLIPIPGNPYFLLKKGDFLKDYSVYNWKNGTLQPLIEEDSLYQGAKVLSYTTVENSSPILFRLKTKGAKPLFLLIDPSADKAVIEDITSLLSADPGRITWDPKDATQLFTLKGGNCNLVDVKNMAVYPKYLQGIRGLGLYQKQIYILKDDNRLFRMNFDKGGKEELLDDPDLGSSIFGDKGKLLILPMTKRIIMFITEDGELLSNHLPYVFVREGVLGTEFYPDDEYLLIWAKDRIGSLDFSVEEAEDVTFEKGPRLMWRYTGGKNINQCFWAYDGSSILFKDNEGVSLLERKAFKKSYLTQIVKVKPHSSAYYSEDSGALYYLDPSSGGRLYSVQILPQGRALIVTEQKDKKDPEEKQEKQEKQVKRK